MVFFFDIWAAPFAKLVVTIIGSISGVKPTATESANSVASSQSPLVKPLINNTIGTITNIKRMSSFDTDCTPFSKPVFILGRMIDFAMVPNIVSFPIATATQVAEPLITLVPINAKLGHSKGV